MTTSTIALALGGGGARGLAHAHIFEALDDLNIKPVAMSGTSIGAIMGAGYAAGMSGKEIREYVIAAFSDPGNVVSRFWRMRPTGIKEFLSGPATLLGNINPKKAVSAFLPEQVPATFEELKIPLQVVATDFYGQKPVVFSSGNLVEAIAASAALPAIFKPVIKNGMALVDGGIQNSLPYDLLLGKADIIVAVDVVGGPKRSKTEIPSRIEALAGASQLMMQATTRLKCQINPPDVMIVPPVNGIGVLDFLRAEKILKLTSSTRELARTLIEEALEKVV